MLWWWIRLITDFCDAELFRVCYWFILTCSLLLCSEPTVFHKVLVYPLKKKNKKKQLCRSDDDEMTDSTCGGHPCTSTWSWYFDSSSSGTSFYCPFCFNSYPTQSLYLQSFCGSRSWLKDSNGDSLQSDPSALVLIGPGGDFSSPVQL